MLPLPLEDLVRERVADRLRQAQHDALVRQSLSAAPRVKPGYLFDAGALRRRAAAGLRLLAQRLDPSRIVTSRRTESVPIQPYARR
jgi:hypothetical protein